MICDTERHRHFRKYIYIYMYIDIEIDRSSELWIRMYLNKNKNYVNILHPLHRNVVFQTKKKLLFSFQPKLNKKPLKTKM